MRDGVSEVITNYTVRERRMRKREEWGIERECEIKREIETKGVEERERENILKLLGKKKIV